MIKNKLNIAKVSKAKIFICDSDDYVVSHNNNFLTCLTIVCTMLRTKSIILVIYPINYSLFYYAIVIIE